MILLRFLLSKLALLFNNISLIVKKHITSINSFYIVFVLVVVNKMYNYIFHKQFKTMA